MKHRAPVFAFVCSLAFGNAASADIIGIGTHTASIYFDSGLGVDEFVSFDIPLGDVTCVFLGTCAGPLQLPLTEVSVGSATGSGQAGLIAGFSSHSWGFLPTIGTMVGQSDPLDETEYSTSLRIEYQLEFFTDATGYATSAVSELLYLNGTVGGAGGWVRVSEELTLESELDGTLAELVVDFYTDTPGSFQGVLSGATPGSGAIEPFDTFWVRGFYLFEAHNLNGPTSVSTTTPPDTSVPVPEPSTAAMIGLGLAAVAARRRRRLPHCPPRPYRVRASR